MWFQRVEQLLVAGQTIFLSTIKPLSRRVKTKETAVLQGLLHLFLFVYVRRNGVSSDLVADSHYVFE